ncbi:MAG: hypothetical protein Q3976_03260 [Corynebacterium sp.]|nr:hypothetical protein [Corynebacterium sp.]
MISVVDYIPATQRLVIWTVQSRIDVATDTLSGAWILGREEAHPLSAAVPITTGTTALCLHEEAAQYLPESVARTSVDAIVSAMEERRHAYIEAAKAAQLENKSLKVPRFAQITVQNPESFREGFHGEEVAEQAWLHAQVLVDLIQQWRVIESTRRGRKVLKEQFGAEPLPLPLHSAN